MYKRNILIGNGINLANKNEFLNADLVNKRFLTILKKKFILFKKALYLDDLDFNDVENSISKCYSLGIENLAGKLFEYIKRKIEEKVDFCWNHCYRLIEIIGLICIESLFIVDEKLKYPYISKEYIEKFNSYDNIFTLNYVETWDQSNRCTYLHGKIDKYLSKYNGEFLISYILTQTAEIKKIIPKNVIKIDLYDVIFIPDNEMVNKYHYVSLGLVPNKCNLPIYPASDLLPYSGKGDIYNSLDGLKSIEIFGVSPYGDKAILEKISKIKDVTVYIYNIDKNEKEVKEWKKYIKHAIFKDSMEFLS